MKKCPKCGEVFMESGYTITKDSYGNFYVICPKCKSSIFIGTLSKIKGFIEINTMPVNEELGIPESIYSKGGLK